MWRVTSFVPMAASPVLRAISRVVADCSSTAALMAVETLSISLIEAWMSEMAATDWRLISCMAAICWPISSVAFEVWPASAFTSAATTAKPRPASPARALSMVAFRARRLV